MTLQQKHYRCHKLCQGSTNTKNNQVRYQSSRPRTANCYTWLSLSSPAQLGKGASICPGDLPEWPKHKQKMIEVRLCCFLPFTAIDEEWSTKDSCTILIKVLICKLKTKSDYDYCHFQLSANGLLIVKVLIKQPKYWDDSSTLSIANNISDCRNAILRARLSRDPSPTRNFQRQMAIIRYSPCQAAWIYFALEEMAQPIEVRRNMSDAICPTLETWSILTKFDIQQPWSEDKVEAGGWRSLLIWDVMLSQP